MSQSQKKCNFTQLIEKYEKNIPDINWTTMLSLR